MEEEGAVIAGLLVGLNVIDANLCMKGEDLDSQVSGTYGLLLYTDNRKWRTACNKVQQCTLTFFFCSLDLFLKKSNDPQVDLWTFTSEFCLGWSHRFFHVSERWSSQQQKHRGVSSHLPFIWGQMCPSQTVLWLWFKKISSEVVVWFQWWTDHSYSWPEELRWRT